MIRKGKDREEMTKISKKEILVDILKIKMISRLFRNKMGRRFL